jgi:hypothetical protein
MKHKSPSTAKSGAEKPAATSDFITHKVCVTRYLLHDLGKISTNRGVMRSTTYRTTNFHHLNTALCHILYLQQFFMCYQYTGTCLL